VIPQDEYRDPLPSFQWPTALPGNDPDAVPLVHVCFNQDWLPLVLGCLLQLTQQQTWDTTDQTDLDLALSRVQQLLYLFEGDCPLIPPGTIVEYGGSTAPDEWLMCDGSAVSRADYAALFTAIGTAFGPGDGTTTFNVPDLRGRVAIGSGSGSGLSTYAIGDTGGEETHTLTTGEIAAHSHTDIGHTHTEGNAAPSLGAAITGVPVPSAVPTIGITGVGNANIQNAGGGGAHNNLQPYLATNHLIKT